MATAAAVSAAVTQVANLLTQEARYLSGIEDQITELRNELLWMKSFLKEADKRQAADERVSRWVTEIRELAYDVEDVIETFALKISSRQKQGCANAVDRATCILKEASLLHKIKSQIEKILERIQKSTRRLQTYGIKQLGDEGSSSSSSERRWEQRLSYPHLVQENVVGLDDKIKELVSVLVDQGKKFPGVSISGMGGIGKTTLAKKVYNHHRIQDHFERRAWVYVSQPCEEKNVWAAILSSLDPTSDVSDIYLKHRDPQELAERLYHLLQETRCLVVLDNVWSTQDWDRLKPGFPMKWQKGNVLVTSRSTDVALHIDKQVFLHEVQRLNEEYSWELFQKIALCGRDLAECVIDKNMEDLGKEMVTCCKGLPLAISSIGGILATKDWAYPEWKKVHENLISYFSKQKVDTVHGTLSLSYEDLPPHLKPCFFYLSHFPEDYDIPTQKLLQMWIAEGFISTTRGEEMEDIAENYLIELLDRHIIQVGERHADLKVKMCRMQDLVRDLCLSKAKEEGFLYIVDHSHDTQDGGSILHIFESWNNSARRLALQKSGVIQNIKNPCLRTLLLFNPLISGDFEDYPKDSLVKRTRSMFKVYYEEEKLCMAILAAAVALCLNLGMMRRCISHIMHNFGMLRVLHIQGENIISCNELKDIDSLTHLRYLCLTGALVSELPSSMGKLSCLLTLDLRNNLGMIKIPDVIWKMRQLRHLYLPESFESKPKLRLQNLENLQTLVNFSTIRCHMEDLCFLKKLKELSIRGFSGYMNNCDQFCAENCCNCVRAFSREGNDYVGLEEDPMPLLEKLPNLRILVIQAGAFMVKEMIYSAEGFVQLKSLTLDNLSELSRLKDC